MSKDKEIGTLGETIAAQHVEAQGYMILCRNYRNSFGELDIIAKDEEDLVFIEVKSRTSQTYGLPVEAVSYRKRRKLSIMAMFYMTQHRLHGIPCRFDVIEVDLRHYDTPQIHHIQNAFSLVT